MTLRPARGRPQSVPFGPLLKQASLEWTYRARNRARFSEPGRIGHLPRESCQRALSGLGVDWATLGRSHAIEVVIPYAAEEEGWEARVFPWEFVLVSALSQPGGPLSVVRSLKRKRAIPVSEGGPVLIIDSAPPAAREDRDFEAECQLVASLFETRGIERLTNPSRAVLEAEVARLEPSVIHVTGVDSHEAEKRGYLAPRRRRNGLFLDGETLDAPELAAALTAAPKKPALVVFNLAYSAARIAALPVAFGAESSIGFHDEADADLALLLLSNFYDSLIRQGRPALGAFRAASLASGAVPATGATFWTAAPVHWPSTSPEEGERLRPPLRPSELQPSGPAPEDLVNVVARPFSTLNYARLYNDRDLFETFLIERRTDRPLHAVKVEVSLFSGGISQPYLSTLDLDARVTDIKPLARVPLVDPALRSSFESLRTLLSVSVFWSGLELTRASWFVTLPPPNEWEDEPSGWPLLPSFVLSLDPFVTALLERARRLLRFLEDDASAGFTGYEQPPEGVDRQVQAIWAALSFEEGLSYSPPPPVFSTTSQRIRTPSQIAASRAGTCLDLALLFAACLEAVDLYPVLFLFAGHAFPGYWRSKAAHDDFRTNPWAAAGMNDSGSGEGPLEEAFLEVQTRVFQGDLVPLETVGLTRRDSFGQGRRTGLSNLASLSGFQALVDVRLARLNGILPLPILTSRT